MIQKEILNELNKQLIAGKIKTDERIVLDVFDGQVVFRKPINQEEEMEV